MSAGNTTVFSPPIGDVVLPITPTTIDAILGSNNPQAATITDLTVTGSADLPDSIGFVNLTVTGTSDLEGAVSGAGIEAAIAGGVTTAAVATALQAGNGTVVLNGATPVDVADTSITANSIMIFTLKTPGGTVGAYPAIQTITPGTGFHVAGTALDTSTYNYMVIG